MSSPISVSFPHTFRVHASRFRAVRGTRLTIREIAIRTGSKYQHIRKIWNGEPVLSLELNHELCALLGINEAAMWHEVQRAQALKNYGEDTDAPAAGVASTPTTVSTAPRSQARWLPRTDTAYSCRYYRTALVEADSAEVAHAAIHRVHPNVHVERLTPVTPTNMVSQLNGLNPAITSGSISRPRQSCGSSYGFPLPQLKSCSAFWSLRRKSSWQAERVCLTRRRKSAGWQTPLRRSWRSSRR